MSGETFRKLKLDNKDLDTKYLPTVVGANGTSLGAIGKINCEIEIGKERFKLTFLVCENLTRSLILGVDLFCKTTCSRSTLDQENLLCTHHQWRNSSRNSRTAQPSSGIIEKENKTPPEKLCCSRHGHQHDKHR